MGWHLQEITHLSFRAPLAAGEDQASGGTDPVVDERVPGEAGRALDVKCSSSSRPDGEAGPAEMGPFDSFGYPTDQDIEA